MYTKEQFIEWLKTKPADEEFDYISGSNCAFAQFLASKGHKDIRVTYDYYMIDGERHELDVVIDEAVLNADTFGGVLKLLEPELA